MAENQAVVSVADLLLRHGLVTREILNEANRRRREEDKTLGQVLYEMKAVNEQQKLELFKRHFGMEAVSLENFKIAPDDLSILPRSFCERNCLVAVMRDRGTLVVAIEDPTNVVVLDEAAGLSNLPIHPVIASCRDIITALAHYPEKKPGEDEALNKNIGKSKSELIHAMIFFILSVLPIPIFVLLIADVKGVQDFYNHLERFEKTLVFFLLWALWAVSVYEVDGLVWSRPKELH